MGRRTLRHRFSVKNALSALALGFLSLLGLQTAFGAASLGTTVHTHILNPPNTITNLTASPVGSPGDVQLVWTAPANLNGIPINTYLVHLATYPASSPATAGLWWLQTQPSQLQIGPAHAPGTTEFGTVSGLTLNVTYYFGIKSLDFDGILSAVDPEVGTANQANSVPAGSSGAPPTPTNFKGVALSPTSIQWSWNLSAGATYYSLNAFPSGTPVAQTAATTFTENTFTANTAISRTISAGSAAGQSPPSSPVTVYTQANAPTGLAVTGFSSSNVALQWAGNGNPAGTQFRLERSLNGITFAPVGQVAALSFNDATVSANTTYYYQVRAVNGDGIVTAPSAIVTAVTDSTPPDQVLGVIGTLDANKQNLIMTWAPVVFNADGTLLTNLAGYNIYRRTTLRGPLTKLNAVPASALWYSDSYNGTLVYYVIRAVKTNGVESIDSLTLDTSNDLNAIYLSTDNLSSLSMPRTINDTLRYSNKYAIPLKITMLDNALPADPSIVRDVNFSLIRSDENQLIHDQSFRIPDATVSIGYNLVGNQVAREDLATSALTPTSATPNQLAIYWNNGVTWVRVDGVLDTINQVVKIKSSFVGRYQLRATSRSGSLNLPDGNVYPRVFTPNGDGFNDVVYFILDNPNGASVQGEIFDLSGRHVVTMPPPNSAIGIGTTLVWDGKDNRSVIVPSGVYIYRIQGEGKTFTGTIAVAR